MSRPHIFLLYGPPASGKTTLANFICKEYNLTYFSFGEAVRKEITNNTSLGKKLKKYLDAVEEYSPELISEVLQKYISNNLKNKKSLLIDGFPKYSREVPLFFDILNREGFALKGVIILEISLGTILQRSSKRMICSSCLLQQLDHDNKNICSSCKGMLLKRNDDDPDILRRRYLDFSNSMNQLSQDLFMKTKVVIHLNGERNKEEIREELTKKMPG